MKSPFFNFKTLHETVPKMLQLIEECYKSEANKVHPQPKPGQLRNILPKQAPTQGHPIEQLLAKTKDVIFPRVMNWQSPKYFGYFPCNVNDTLVLSEMFAATFQSPAFSFNVAPAYTELQNIMSDWTVKAMGLPDKFLLGNSGGGIINNTASESIIVSVHLAQYKKMKELQIQGNNPKVLNFVGYYGQGSHASSKRALGIKNVYYQKPAPYKYNPELLNYEIDVQKFQKLLEEDVNNGLIPFWFGASYGTTFSQAVDINQSIINLCKKYKMWLNLDAAWLGPTWICQKHRPQPQILQNVDSIQINYSKLMLNGMGASWFYIGDKKLLAKSFGSQNPDFSIYENEFTKNYDVVDYKDWVLGLGRRNNSLKIYYFYTHYGLDKIREQVSIQEKKALYLLELIKQHSNIFHLHTFRYLTVLFQIKGKDGKPSNELTKKVAEKIKSIQQGYSTPAQFLGTYVMRIVVGNFNSFEAHIKTYFDKIKEIAQLEINSQH